MDENKRATERSDRRAKTRGGRRDNDMKPWYMRRRLWVAAASLMFVGWKRIRRIGQSSSRTNRNIAA